MLGKRSRPAIGKLAGVLRSGIVDTMISPRSPLDFRTLASPRGQKSNYHDQYEGGIGLGIVVALDKSSCKIGYGGEVIPKYAICSQISSCSKPINVVEKNKHHHGTLIKHEDENIDEFEEEFTYVTCRGPNKSTTKVYYSGGQFGHDQQQTIEPKICKKIGVFNISPARFTELDCNSNSDFLSSCYLCRKGLHGKDIYMYRGEKAFCSEECRQRQIGIDERKEQCRSEASRSTEVATSPYSYTATGQIFSTGIVAV